MDINIIVCNLLITDLELSKQLINKGYDLHDTYKEMQEILLDKIKTLNIEENK